MTDKKQPLTKEEFSELVEQYAMDNGLELVPAIIAICQENDIDYESVPKIITDDLKEKIAVSEDMHSMIYGKTSALF